MNTFAHLIATDKVTAMISERIQIKLMTWKRHNQIEEESGKPIYAMFLRFFFFFNWPKYYVD